MAGRGAFALDSQDLGSPRVEAADRALARVGIGWDNAGAVELNEAFGVQSLACVEPRTLEAAQSSAATRSGYRRSHPGDPRRGAASRRAPLERVAATCIGVGQALAVVLENVAGWWQRRGSSRTPTLPSQGSAMWPPC